MSKYFYTMTDKTNKNNNGKTIQHPSLGEGLGGLARLDKWLWASRIFIIAVRKPPVTFTFRILKTIEQRVGAKLLPEIYENITTPDQYELLEMNRISGFVDRQRGTGRPTKKDRRQMDAFVTPALEGFGDWGAFDFDDDD